MLKGRTITLLRRQQTGVDAFNRPTYTETPVQVENVLIAPLSDQEVLDTLNLTGRKAVYQLGIPKGDTNDWENQRVQFFGETWEVIVLNFNDVPRPATPAKKKEKDDAK